MRPSAAFASASMAVAAGLVFAGCMGSCNSEGLVPGTGYVTEKISAWNFTVQNSMLDADLSPDGQLLAVLFNNGTVELWTAAGQWVQTIPFRWGPPEFPNRSCGPLPSAVEFLNATALVAGCGPEIAAWSLTGGALWNITMGSPSQVVDLAVADGGANLVIANGSGSARVRHIASGAEHAIGNPLVRVRTVVASPDGAVVAAIGDGEIWVGRSGGGELGRFPQAGLRPSTVAFTGEGREAYTAELLNWSGLDVDVVARSLVPNAPAPLRVHVGNETLLPDGGTDTSQALLSVSPSGRFVAVGAYLRLWHIDYGTDVFVVRIVDLQDPAREIGFHAGRGVRVFPADDGSALALYTGGDGLYLVHMNANATLPTKVSVSQGAGSCF